VTQRTGTSVEWLEFPHTWSFLFAGVFAVIMAASLMMLIPVTTVAINHHMTTRGHLARLKTSPILRFVVVGAMSYTVVSFQGSLQALRSVNEISHFTHYTVAHAHLGVYAFFSMVMFGAIYYIVPRLTGREWPAPRLIKIHFWCTAIGMAAKGILEDRKLAAILMTGDRSDRAAITRIDRALTEMTPEEKAAEVRRLHLQGARTLFVGDGVNDAIAMAEADVSIAVAEGSDLASEVAEVVWHGGDLRVIPWALDLSRATVATIRSNLWIAAGYNLIGVTLAAAGVLHPVTTTLEMTVSSLVVTWRAVRVLQESEDELFGPWSDPDDGVLQAWKGAPA